MTNYMCILLTSPLKSFVELLGALVIFVFVLVIVYLTTKWMGGLQQARSTNKNLRIVETIGVGNNKYITIVEAGTVYLVVAVGREEVHLLAELTKEQLKDVSFAAEAKTQTEAFSDILNRLKDKLPKKRD